MKDGITFYNNFNGIPVWNQITHVFSLLCFHSFTLSFFLMVASPSRGQHRDKLDKQPHTPTYSCGQLWNHEFTWHVHFLTAGGIKYSWSHTSTGRTCKLHSDKIKPGFKDLKDLIVRYFPNRALCPQTAGLLVVPRVSKSRMGGRAFSYQAPLLWNKLPVYASEADTLSTFKIMLKTFLFHKAYS